MRTVFAIIIAVSLVGCATPVPHVANDSGAAVSLGVTDQEWSDIQKLAAEEKGWMPDTVLKIRKNLVEIRFEKKDSDKDMAVGGIARRYKRGANGWTKTDYSGDWHIILLP